MRAAAETQETAQVSAAASTAVASLLDGPVQRAVVIGAYPAAIYLQAADGVLALATPDAVKLPNALTLHPADHATVVRHADSSSGRLAVGGGGVHVDTVEVVVGRWWDPVPRLGSRLDAATLAARFDELESLLPPWPDPGDPAAGRLAAGRDLLAAALAGRASADHAAHHLIGLGPGLTPAGDDLLAGAVAGLVIFDSALGQAGASTGTAPATGATATAAALSAAAARRSASTTPLAADLARHAARGAVAGPVADLCRALAGRRPIRPAVERLLAVGHTSGSDLAEGLLLGGRCLGSG